MSEEVTKEEVAVEEPSAGAPPQVDFSNFVLSLATSALVHMGEVKDPALEGVEKNLPMSKHTIDALDMIKEKTKGNLDEKELKLLENVLYELRMRYMKLADAAPEGSGKEDEEKNK